jgi:hypothetical protein
VTGGREYVPNREDVTVFLRLLSDVLAAYPKQEAVLRHGGCRGVDRAIAALVRQAFPRIAVVEYKANWDLLGKLAGPKRNAEMLEGADALIAFPGGRGTASCIRIAEQKRVPIYYTREPVVPRATPFERKTARLRQGEHRHDGRKVWWSSAEASWMVYCLRCRRTCKLDEKAAREIEQAVERHLEEGP